MVGGFRSILCVSVFQGSLLVIVMMIDGSKKRNCEGAFKLQSSRVFEKRSKIHFKFAYYSFFHIHLKLKRQIGIPSKTIPKFRPNTL